MKKRRKSQNHHVPWASQHPTMKPLPKMLLTRYQLHDISIFKHISIPGATPQLAVFANGDNQVVHRSPVVCRTPINATTIIRLNMAFGQTCSLAAEFQGRMPLTLPTILNSKLHRRGAFRQGAIASL
jgi:hypothetical protein